MLSERMPFSDFLQALADERNGEAIYKKIDRAYMFLFYSFGILCFVIKILIVMFPNKIYDLPIIDDDFVKSMQQSIPAFDHANRTFVEHGYKEKIASSNIIMSIDMVSIFLYECIVHILAFAHLIMAILNKKVSKVTIYRLSVEYATLTIAKKRGKNGLDIIQRLILKNEITWIISSMLAIAMVFIVAYYGLIYEGLAAKPLYATAFGTIASSILILGEALGFSLIPRWIFGFFLYLMTDTHVSDGGTNG